jgi:aminomethyltransferase
MTYTVLREQQRTAGAVLVELAGFEVVAHYGDPAREYAAAHESVALFDNSPTGCLWLRDRDRAALLHRLSTNDIEGLEPGQGIRTVLTNHNGRIIDALLVYALADELLVVTTPQQRAAVARLLKKNIFFNDQVKIEDTSDMLCQLTLFGPQAGALLDDLTGQPISELPLHAIVVAQVGDARAWIARTLPLGGAGFALYVPIEPVNSLPMVWLTLQQAGAQPLGQDAHDLLRVEAGYPAFGRELTLDYIPLETGLWDAVSFTKGCYVGQEIIARMESRNRIAKQLRGLKLSAPVAAPASLTVEGSAAGNLTSAVQSPRYGPIALAYVRSKHAEPGTQVGIAESDVTGEVVALPFGAA